MQNLLTTLDRYWRTAAAFLRARPWVLCLVAVLALGGYLYGAGVASRTVNARYKQGDQDAYLSYAIDLRDSDFQHVGSRNRMPMYPGLQALFFAKGTPREVIFERGKWVNVGLSLVGLALLGVVIRRYVSPWATFLFVGSAAVSLYLPKAAYFQAEITYYTLFTLLFIAGAYLVHRPSWWAALLTGLLAALAHWAKASVLPAVVLLAFLLTLRGLWALWQWRQQGPAAGKQALLAVVCAVLVPAAFIAGLWPYLQNSAKIYRGHYFHNVNSSFYIWLDSFEEARVLRKAGDRTGWPRLPEEQIPSARKYFQEKSPGEIAGRLFGGMYDQLRVFKSSYRARNFLLPLLGLVGWQLWAGRRHLRGWAGEFAFPLLFAAGFFGGYFLLISFYRPIADGARFIFALYLPVLAALYWVSESFRRHEIANAAEATVPEKSPSPHEWVYRLLTVLILIEFPYKLIWFMGDTYAGS